MIIKYCIAATMHSQMMLGCSPSLVGQIHHNYMKGGRGWLARISGCSFKPNVSTFWGYNNIKIGSTTYGMFDMRTDTSWFAPTSNYFQHCNFNVVNNTFGNLTANDGNGTGTGLIIITRQRHCSRLPGRWRNCYREK